MNAESARKDTQDRAGRQKMIPKKQAFQKAVACNEWLAARLGPRWEHVPDSFQIPSWTYRYLEINVRWPFR